MTQLTEKLLKAFSLKEDYVLRKAWGSRPVMRAKPFIVAWLRYKNRDLVAKNLGISHRTCTRICKELMPSIGRQRTYHVLLEKVHMRPCSTCGEVRGAEHFYTKGVVNLSSECKECENTKSRYKSSIRRARVLKAIPLWQSLVGLKDFYDKCPAGYEVDHVIPLRGVLVSGLHVVENLQYLTKHENRKKSNTYHT